MRIWVKPDLLASSGSPWPTSQRAIRGAERGEPGRADRRRAGAAGPAVHLHRARAGPPRHARGVRRRRRAREPRRLAGAARRRRARSSSARRTTSSAARFNGKPAGGHRRLPDARARTRWTCADSVQATMDELKQRFPPRHRLRRSRSTPRCRSPRASRRSSSRWSRRSCWSILVVFIFLQNWRATLIPLLTVPVSLVGVFALFPLLGFSINTLSLFGLVLAIGLVVDDAIVVVEAVEHHIEEGMTPRDATLQGDGGGVGPGRRHRAGARGGVHPGGLHRRASPGRLYQQFALTIAISVLISAFNALTLSPALCALLLKPQDAATRGCSAAASGVLQPRFERGRPTATSASTGSWCARRCSSLAAARWRCSRAVAGALGKMLPPASCPTRTRATLSRRRAAARRRLAAADRRRSCEKVEDDPRRAPRASQLRQHHRRLQPAHRAPSATLRRRSSSSRSSRGTSARRTSCSPGDRRPRSTPQLAEDPRGARSSPSARRPSPASARRAASA